ncbi:9490_t:CDS:1 [Rhizophagus irregularis]|nr:9490_t:CDS:1 [Rhizophagus irregularis]
MTERGTLRAFALTWEAISRRSASLIFFGIPVRIATCSLQLLRWVFEKDARQIRKELPRQIIAQISLNWAIAFAEKNWIWPL